MTVWTGLIWIKRQSSVNTATTIRVPQQAGNFSVNISGYVLHGIELICKNNLIHT